MSGIEEKPIKKEVPSLSAGKRVDMLFEDYMNGQMPGRRRERRKQACRGIVLNLVFLVVTFCITVWNFNVEGRGILDIGFSAFVCVFLLWCIKYEFKTYVDNREVNAEEVSDVGR